MTKDEERTGLKELEALMNNTQKQIQVLIQENEKFKRALRYYADKKHMRDIAMVDQGTIARYALLKI